MRESQSCLELGVLPDRDKAIGVEVEGASAFLQYLLELEANVGGETQTRGEFSSYDAVEAVVALKHDVGVGVWADVLGYAVDGAKGEGDAIREVCAELDVERDVLVAEHELELACLSSHW